MAKPTYAANLASHASPSWSTDSVEHGSYQSRLAVVVITYYW